MLRSFMSGIAGMKSYQTKMDVIGNNVANVNTIGFKASSVNFSDVFYQNIQGSTSNNIQTQKAGTNAKQIGYGSTIASINNAVSIQGGNQTTSRALDMMINGNAFFIVGMDGQNYFTKNGAFDIDGAGYLSTESGGLVMGWNVDRETGNLIQDTVSPIQIWSPENQYAEPKGTTDTYFQGNIDSNDIALEEGKIIQMDFYDNLGNQYAAKYKVVSSNAEDNNEYEVILTDIIDSNEQSIFVNAKTSNGQTTYSLKNDVSVDFAGYTYKAVEVDKVTGAVRLQSYNVDGTETLGKVFEPAKIIYPFETRGFKGQEYLYKQIDNRMEVIPRSEINNYLKIDSSTGKLSLNFDYFKTIKDYPYYLYSFNEPVPIIKDTNTSPQYVTGGITKYDYINLFGDQMPYKLNTSKMEFEQLNIRQYNSIFGKDASGNLTMTMHDRYYAKIDDAYYRISNSSTPLILALSIFSNITGTPDRYVSGPINKGANLLFNASTGKFASATSAVTRFDENGNPITNSVSLKIHTSDSQIATSAKDLFNEITVDFSSLTMYADGGNSNINSVRGQIGTAGEGAGYMSGNLTGVSVSNDGKIYGKYDNGIQKVLGQIAVTSFANPTGLEAVGNSLFQTTVNSGDFDGVGSDVMAIGLSITAGSLETSNVDLSNEFTNMVTTQRGYEANSKVIMTSDRIIESLISLKR